MPRSKKLKQAIISLGGEHTHRGAKYNRGDLIRVRGDQAATLIKHHNARTATADEQEQFNNE